MATRNFAAVVRAMRHKDTVVSIHFGDPASDHPGAMYVKTCTRAVIDEATIKDVVKDGVWLETADRDGAGNPTGTFTPVVGVFAAPNNMSPAQVNAGRAFVAAAYNDAIASGGFV